MLCNFTGISCQIRTKLRDWANGARVLQIQNQFQESAAGKWCKGSLPRNFARFTRATSGGTRAIATTFVNKRDGDTVKWFGISLFGGSTTGAATLTGRCLVERHPRGWKWKFNWRTPPVTSHFYERRLYRPCSKVEEDSSLDI